MQAKKCHIVIGIEIFKPSMSTLNQLERFIPLFSEEFYLDIFTFYKEKNRETPYICQDHHGHWYVIASEFLEDCTNVKSARQLAKRNYMKQFTEPPIMHWISEHQLCVNQKKYDKAYLHTSVLVDSIKDFPTLDQIRLALSDGLDDPITVTCAHYLKNIYAGLETRFISGVETNSFATVTENEYYYENIHTRNAAQLYLLYFMYFQLHNSCPSPQMFPRLLCNLWASQQILRSDFNPNLYEVMVEENL